MPRVREVGKPLVHAEHEEDGGVIAEGHAGVAFFDFAQGHAADERAFRLAECANTIWKKTRRGEIPDSRPYRQELADLPDVLMLCPDRGLVERATRLANLIGKLSDEEMIDLLACGWLGADALPTWRQSFEYAERTFTTLAPRYVTGYAG